MLAMGASSPVDMELKHLDFVLTRYLEGRYTVQTLLNNVESTGWWLDCLTKEARNWKWQ
jgi:hypothetical protein